MVSFLCSCMAVLLAGESDSSGSLHYPHHHTLATNVSVTGSFAICRSICSTVRDNFDFITKWM